MIVNSLLLDEPWINKKNSKYFFGKEQKEVFRVEYALMVKLRVV
ncbi:hypothetical protein [Aureispira sp. CCB-QB1]|nr:hypothetical protein [Aureispira sp. CCB-QB1]